MLTIKLSLSEKGRKADLLAGGDGAALKTLIVGREDASFPGLLEIASMTDKGAVVDLHVWNTPSFDAMPTPAEVLQRELARKQEKIDKEAAEKVAVTERTLAVLRNKETEKKSCAVSHGIFYTYEIPNWPYNRDNSIVESSEAVAWIAELEAQKATAKAAAEAEVLVQEAKKKADAEAKAARIAAHRASRNLEEGDIDLNIEDGALTRVPCWESHSRGKNWLAIISVDPRSPGGLARDFAAKAKGDSYYMVPDWKIGDAVEFGADYISGGGRKTQNRWYGFVVRIETDYVVLRKIAGGKTAVKAGVKYLTTLEKVVS